MLPIGQASPAVPAVRRFAGRRVPELRTGPRGAEAHVREPPAGRLVGSAIGELNRDGPQGRARLAQDRPRHARRASPWRWPLLLLLPVVLGARWCSTGCARARRSRRSRWRPSRWPSSTDARPSAGHADPDRLRLRGGAAQGRRLRQDPGPPRRAAGRGGQPACARARCSRGSRAIDYEAAVQRAQAAVQRAEADLAESPAPAAAGGRPREAEDRSPRTSARPRRAACKIAEAQLAQAQADLAFAEAQLQNTRDPRALQRASWSRRWPRWARASRRSRRA